MRKVEMFVMVLLSCTVLVACEDGGSKQNIDKGFQVVETLDVECEVDEDCKTPDQYLIMSHCPYDSKCIENQCAVICPEPFEGRAVPELE